MRASLQWVACAAITFLLYAAFIHLANPQVSDRVFTHTDSRRIALEDFLFLSNPPSAVFVGSSHGAVLPQATLAPIYNLSLPGGSSLTGVDLIRAFDMRPQLLPIEVNSLLRPAESELIAETTNPISLWIKRVCLACRTKYQPLTVGLSFIENWLHKPPSAEELDQRRMTEQASPQILARMLQVQLASGADVPSGTALNWNLEALATKVAAFEKIGTRVVFVVMPMHPDVLATPYYRFIIENTKRYFPPNHFHWIEFTEKSYRTSDSVHLIYPDAKEVAAKIRVAVLPE